VILETELRPRPPYSLALSARLKSDATRAFRDGVLTTVFEAGGEPALASALDLLRFVLACDDDHREFVRRFSADPLLGAALRCLRGLRPLRVSTVTHALLKAVCGQLIQARAARLLEAKLIRSACPPHGELRLPPTRSTFARLSTAELARHGLVARKANALVRVSRETDLERLKAVPTEAARTRIERERGLGPWSAGMVCLYGLGRFEHGLVGDLGLIRLCGALLGRRADEDDTRELLARYGEWAGLASVYLLAGAPRPARAARPA
jgi:3-methyladenine DNA glycosylase/8-oxoguanine DNA glycosylase